MTKGAAALDFSKQRTKAGFRKRSNVNSNYQFPNGYFDEDDDSCRRCTITSRYRPHAARWRKHCPARKPMIFCKSSTTTRLPNGSKEKAMVIGMGWRRLS
jgi:hypothetical protein